MNEVLDGVFPGGFSGTRKQSSLNSKSLSLGARQMILSPGCAATSSCDLG
jgi:hypothetical protein